MNREVDTNADIFHLRFLWSRASLLLYVLPTLLKKFDGVKGAEVM